MEHMIECLRLQRNVAHDAIAAAYQEIATLRKEVAALKSQLATPAEPATFNGG